MHCYSLFVYNLSFVLELSNFNSNQSQYRVLNNMKGYKIANCTLDKKFGIAGGSLKDIVAKGCQKLKVKISILKCI